MSNKTPKIEAFATSNDTNKYVVIINKFFQFFDTKEAAENFYNQYQDVEDQPFGSIQLLPPNYSQVDAVTKISDHMPIDLKKYVERLKQKLSIKCHNFYNDYYLSNDYLNSGIAHRLDLHQTDKFLNANLKIYNQ